MKIILSFLLALTLSAQTQTTVNGRKAYSGAVNPQTATYQALVSDFNAPCGTIPVASGTFTITLVASGSQPPAVQCVTIINYGSGVVTVARSGQNINGATTSLTLAAAASSIAPTGATVVSDGTNYAATVFGQSGSSGASTESHAASNSVELDFTTCLLAGTQTYRLELIGIVPATNGANILVQVSTNGGATYDTATNYTWVGRRESVGGVAQSQGSNAISSWGMDVATGESNTTTTGSLGADIVFWFPANASAYRMLFSNRGFSWDGSANPGIWFISAGAYKSTTQPNAFRVIASSGNLTSGDARCYSVPN